MFGSLGNLAGLMKQAKSFQENMQKMQEQLVLQQYEADAGAGMVRAVVNGKGDLMQLKIDPQALEDRELLEDLVVAAVGAASQKAQEAAKEQVAQMTGGLNIPGLTDLLGQGS